MPCLIMAGPYHTSHSHAIQLTRVACLQASRDLQIVKEHCSARLAWRHLERMSDLVVKFGLLVTMLPPLTSLGILSSKKHADDWRIKTTPHHERTLCCRTRPRCTTQRRPAGPEVASPSAVAHPLQRTRLLEPCLYRDRWPRLLGHPCRTLLALVDRHDCGRNQTKDDLMLIQARPNSMPQRVLSVGTADGMRCTHLTWQQRLPQRAPPGRMGPCLPPATNNSATAPPSPLHPRSLCEALSHRHQLTA